MDVCPRDVIVEYAKLNPDRAVSMLSTWEKFPVELFKLVSVQRSRCVVTTVRVILQTMGRLCDQPANWEDLFEEKTMATIKCKNFEDYLAKTKAAALTAQAKAEKALERVAKARRLMAADPTALDRRTLIALHYGTGPSDEQAAAGAQKRPDHDPTRVASHRTRKRRELPNRNRQKMLENLRAGDLTIPPAPAQTAVLDQASIQPMDTAPSAEPRPSRGHLMRSLSFLLRRVNISARKRGQVAQTPVP